MILPAALALAGTLAASAGDASATAPLHSASDSVLPGRAASSDVGHALASAREAGFRMSELLLAEDAIREEVERGALPGAALAAGRGDRVVVETGIGVVGRDPGDGAVDPDRTEYDLASLTKVVATTTAAMVLWEDGVIDLDAPVSAYLPEFRGGGRERVTIRHLLTHTSGLPEWVNLGGVPEVRAMDRVLSLRLEAAPGARVRYSDVGFVVLHEALERAAGEPLYRLLDRRVFGPLGMRSTTWVPGEGCRRCAPTSRRHGDAFRGRVHDPISRRLGGVAGNAGLFSTAHDLARFAAMLAREGEMDGVQVLLPSTVREFTRRQPGADTRALGWDTPDASGRGAAGTRISPRAFGHTGFTGTSLWVDPERGTWVVLLANRTYEERVRLSIQALRRTVHDRVTDASDAPVLLGVAEEEEEE